MADNDKSKELRKLQEEEMDLAFRSEQTTIVPVDLEQEMKKSFIDYAMSVISDRALPDVRDGLKPVQRRILYSMYTQGFTPDKPYRKCATTIGDVLGRFHPHGDASVYDALVRLAQDFSLRHPLVDGHGNFGSIDGDPPAAYRYTEARLAKVALEMMTDIKKGIEFRPNFDEHEFEPVALPSRFPNLLVNGSVGIAVGMATNIPPHNMGEVIDGVVMMLDNPEVTLDELLTVVKGPDFPTGGAILGTMGIREAYTTGRGRIMVRAHAEIEEHNGGRQRIIIHDLPFAVNKARLIERMADLVKEKKVEGISGLRDESDRNEMVRIVIEVKKEANPEVVLNQLYKNCALQDACCANMIALVPDKDGKLEPKTITLFDALRYYIEHQENVVTKRTEYDLEQALGKRHIDEGLLLAIDHIDEIINIIRSSRTEADAKARMCERFGFSDKQAQHIVDMRLGRLTGLEREKLEAEIKSLDEAIAAYKLILSDKGVLHETIKKEILEIKRKFATPRVTEIINGAFEDVDDESLIQEENIVVTLTHYGYIKRQRIDVYKELINKLKQQVRESTVKGGQLKKIIDNLTQQMEEKDKQLAALREELDRKDIHIAQLDEKVANLNTNVTTLTEENTKKEETISTQDKALHSAWFVFGTKKELKEQNILSDGEVLRSNFNKDYFTKIDIRIDKEIKLYSKSAKMMTSHPASSYTLQRDANKQYVLRITDPDTFWSTSKYLVVMVK